MNVNILFAFVSLSILNRADSHSRMVEPLSRNSILYNYANYGLFCGGFDRFWLWHGICTSNLNHLKKYRGIKLNLKNKRW